MTAKPAASNQNECIVGQLLLLLLLPVVVVMMLAMLACVGRIHAAERRTLNTDKTANGVCVCCRRPVARSLHDSEATRTSPLIDHMSETKHLSALHQICPAGLHVWIAMHYLCAGLQV